MENKLFSDESEKRIKQKIERFLRKGWSKNGVVGNFDYSNDSYNQFKKYDQLEKWIDEIFEEILKEGKHISKALKSGKSVFLQPI